jgi:hypothetical protein
MATASLATRGFNYQYSLSEPGGRGPVIIDFPVAANTGRVGDLVVLSSGRAALAAANAANVFGVVAESWAGATAGDLRKVAIIMPGQVWAAKVDGVAIAASDIGTRTVNVANAYEIDTTPLTSGTLILVDVDTAGLAAFVTFASIAFAATS